MLTTHLGLFRGDNGCDLRCTWHFPPFLPFPFTDTEQTQGCLLLERGNSSGIPCVAGGRAGGACGDVWRGVTEMSLILFKVEIL